MITLIAEANRISRKKNKFGIEPITEKITIIIIIESNKTIQQTAIPIKKNKII